MNIVENVFIKAEVHLHSQADFKSLNIFGYNSLFGNQFRKACALAILFSYRNKRMEGISARESGVGVP